MGNAHGGVAPSWRPAESAAKATYCTQRKPYGYASSISGCLCGYGLLGDVAVANDALHAAHTITGRSHVCTSYMSHVHVQSSSYMYNSAYITRAWHVCVLCDTARMPGIISTRGSTAWSTECDLCFAVGAFGLYQRVFCCHHRVRSLSVGSAAELNMARFRITGEPALRKRNADHPSSLY